MTSTIARFEPVRAPCGKVSGGEQFTAEDQQGLVTLDVRFACGCHRHKEEFHDGSVHLRVVRHDGKILVDDEYRGE